MKFINLQLCPKFTTVILSFSIFVYHSDLSASNDHGPERSDFHRAALAMRDEIFSNCVIKFDDRTTFKSNGSITSSDAGTRTFARHQYSIFAESLISNSADQNRPSATNNLQYTMDNGNRCIGIIYTQEKSAKILQHVFCLPDPSYDAALRHVCKSVELDQLLIETIAGGPSLIDLTMLNPVSIRADSATGSYSAIYNSVYGTIEVGLEMFEDRYAISKLKIVQNMNDVYTGLSGVNKLSDIHKSILGDTPNGLISVESGLKIYRQNNTGRPFSTIVSYNIYKSHESSWSSDRTLLLTEYRKIHNSDEIIALHLPIPDGQSVQSLDPEYKSLALAYRGGEVVRQVDGKSLDEVIASDQKRGRLTRIALMVLAGVLVLGAVGLLVRWRTKRRAGKVVAP